jgi:transcriptional regulatory protein RtcR
MQGKTRVVMGILGNVKDARVGPDGPQPWRPTPSIVTHPEWPVDRVEILCEPRFAEIADEVRADILGVSPQVEVRVHLLDFTNPWDFEDAYGGLHDFLKSYPFDPQHEEYFVHITTGTHVQRICLFLLTESHYIPGKLLQTRSPTDAASERMAGYTIIDLDLSKYDRLRLRFQHAYEDDLSFLKSGIPTRNDAFNRLIEQVERVAVRSPGPLLLTGPTGAGKSRLAGQLYELKKARGQVAGAFVEVNCATLRGEMAMSALFGHVKGAFTGAISDRAGLLRAADGGVLFLDEIGELGLDEQAMLLQAVEEHTFLPVGADRAVKSSFQLICGTNQDLAARVAGGKFREDLLSRINLWTFQLPGLRDRPEDIEPNLDFELDRFAGASGLNVVFEPDARQRFLAFATSSEAVWRRNFRDLNGAITRMATLAPSGRITTDVVDQEISRLRQDWRGCQEDHADGLDELLGHDRGAALDRFDRAQLAEVIRVCRQSNSLSEAGRALFAASRLKKRTPNDADRLRKYLARFGLTWQGVVNRTTRSG